MKFTKIISLLLVFATLTLTVAGCNFTIDMSTTEPEESTEAPTTTTTTTESTTNPETPEEDIYVTVAEAIEIAKAETSTAPTKRYYIRATIVKVSNPAYGEMTIADETGEIYVYGVYSADGSIGYAAFEEKPVKGDEVLLHCTLNTHNGTPQVKNARLIEFTPGTKEDIDVTDYTEMTIADARDVNLGTKVKVTGVVARITYANGMKPSGVYIVDGTNSIYVYDTDIAGQVAIGNKITVLGEKDFWILETEMNAANKHGYQGCCQISSATLYENDKSNNEIDFSWCEELTVKEILNTPVTENVTTTIFKTNALVKKVPGNGFVNYYFFDLDGETGAYTYTQCNGSDFKWLDEFDGKICTVYLSPMNAKSTTTDCYFRFLPVEVIDEGFVFDLANTPEHIVEYYGIDQFLSAYTGNPLKELITSISSELLGFENATLSYSSSNENILYFEEVDGALILNCKNNGTVTVTITGTYGEYTYEASLEITVDAPVEANGITIEEAIDFAVGETVQVEGIIGPSLVNKDGFYLIDETGAIAVLVNDPSVWEGLAIGQKVIVEGTRDKFNSGSKGYGVTCITSATILVNYYGQHEYPTTSFITDKTLDDFYGLNANEDHTTEVYVCTGTVSVEESNYYSNIKLVTASGQKLTLYSSSANQYNWLKAYAGQEITVEIVPCNWNGKTYYTGCVIAVITAEGKICNELNFTSGK